MSPHFAYDRIEQLRLAFQEMRVKWRSAEFSTTISGGMAIFPDDGATPEDLLQLPIAPFMLPKLLDATAFIYALAEGKAGRAIG